MARHDRGWVKFYRTAIEEDIGQRGNFTLGLWARLVGLANWKGSRSIYFDGENIELKPGQIVTGLRELSPNVKEDPYLNNARAALNYLERRGSIAQAINNQGRIVTILNYDLYNGSVLEPTSDGGTGAQTTHKRCTNAPQLSEELKKERKEEEGKGASPAALQPPALHPVTSEDIKLCSETWKETLRHFKAARSLLAEEETQIARSIQRWGKTAVLLALEGARHEPRDEKFDPSKYLRLSRYLDQDNFQRFLNLGTQARHKAGSA